MARNRRCASLDARALAMACESLADSDPQLARLVDAYGVPPLWARDVSLRTLVHIVLEQKISIRSARAVFDRVDGLLPTFTAEHLRAVSADALREAGTTHAKAGYCHAIAQAILDGQLDLDALSVQDDKSVRQRLCAIRGIGPWTADVFLTMALCRPDVWPTGDRALAVSVAESLALDDVPSYAMLDQMARRWSPHRASAARIFWHAYLCRRGQTAP